MSIVLTLAVLGTWVLIGIGLAALGVLFLNRLAGEIEPSWEHLYYGVWTGTGLVFAGLMLSHFFLPVNGRTLGVFAAIAALSLLVERRWFAAVLRLPINRGLAVVLTVFGVWIANHSIAGSGMDDHQYEFQTIRWFYQYPIVPGLGNLHGRFALNSSHHLFAAMLSVGPWRGLVNHIFNGFFLLLACFLFLDALWDIAARRPGSIGRSVFPALLLCPCVSVVSFGRIGPLLPTLKADVFICAASAILACLFLRWAAAAAGTRTSAILWTTILMVGSVIASVKLSGAVFSGLILAVAVLPSLGQLWRGELRYKRLAAASLAVAFALTISIPIRGIVLSGLPFYPLTVFQFNVDWRVPTAQSDAEHAFITTFARLRPTFSREKVAGQRWVRGWARFTALTDKINTVLALVLTLACIPLLLLSRRANAGSWAKGAPPQWAYLTLACAAATAWVIWFREAPDPRFDIAIPWILFAVLLTWTVQRQQGQWNWTAMWIGLGITLPFAAFVLLVYLRISGQDGFGMVAILAFVGLWIAAFGWLQTARPGLLAALCVSLTLFQYCDHGAAMLLHRHYEEFLSMFWVNASHFPDPAPKAPELLRTYSGLTIYKTDFAGFESPMPNSPFFNPYLQLRGASLGNGFRNNAPDPYRHYAGSGDEALGYHFEGWQKDVDTITPFHLLDLQKPFVD